MSVRGCVQADNISTLVKAANVTVDPYWPGLFAKLFEKTSIEDLISNVGVGEYHLKPTASSCSTMCKWHISLKLHVHMLLHLPSLYLQQPALGHAVA